MLDAQSAHRERDPRTRRLGRLGTLIGPEERGEPHCELVARQVGSLLSDGWRYGHQPDNEHERKSRIHRSPPLHEVVCRGSANRLRLTVFGA